MIPSRDTKAVCIIGAGLAGLSAAYDLGRKGFAVTLLEASDKLGGLASSTVIDGNEIERFYHFICNGDDGLLQLIDELGIGSKLHWREVKTSFFHDGKLYPFGSPFDLLRFTPVPLVQRLRFGLNVFQSRFRKRWMELDGKAAKAWLIDQIGEQAYKVIWDPLLRVKFGMYHEQVSAAWIWHRIHRVATSRRNLFKNDFFGYLEGGSETIVKELSLRLERMPNVEIRTRTPVRKINYVDERISSVEVVGGVEPLPINYLISTIDLKRLISLIPEPENAIAETIGEIEYLGVVCGLLKLTQSVTDSFWVNVNDDAIPFNGFIEYSNLNRHLDIEDRSIVYIPYYILGSDERFSMSDEALLREFVEGLNRVNPEIGDHSVVDYTISRATGAQAVCSVGFSKKVPAHATPVEGMFITDSTQFYPEDRTISAAIRLGRRVATLIQADQNKAK